MISLLTWNKHLKKSKGKNLHPSVILFFTYSYIYAMNLKRNILSLLFLTIYTIVLAHNFIPHHHHSDILGCKEQCQEHSIQASETCCSLVKEHGHKHHNHTFCNFEIKTILSKMVKLSVFYIESDPIEFIRVKPKSTFVAIFDDSQITFNPYYHDISLRAPPLFS
jgi:hypothetical protein